MSKLRIAIFASGQGSNALNIITHFRNHQHIEIAFVLSNRADAKVLEESKKQGIEAKIFENSKVENGAFLTDLCTLEKIDFILLAGYLRKIPTELIVAFPERIINIHPALLPKFGGAGMYGKYVHEAVISQKETETGITIHYVNTEFDSGRIIAQFRCRVLPEDDIQKISQKIHQLEQAYFPMVVEKTILNHGSV